MKESDIVFESLRGRAWVIKRRSTRQERVCNHTSTEDPTPAHGTMGPFVWDVVTYPSRHTSVPVLDSTYTFEALAIARAKHLEKRWIEVYVPEGEPK